MPTLLAKQVQLLTTLAAIFISHPLAAQEIAQIAPTAIQLDSPLVSGSGVKVLQLLKWKKPLEKGRKDPVPPRAPEPGGGREA